MAKARKNSIKKFVGKIFWIIPNISHAVNETESETQNGNIPRAIMNDNIFSIEWTSNSQGGIKLKTLDSINYFGKFTYNDREHQMDGKINARFYENKKGCLLIGQWLEDGDDFTIILELQRVKKFNDEMR